MPAEYNRCPRCGNTAEDSAILKCDNGHVYCESCESSSPIRSTYGYCPVCEEPGSCLGTVESGSRHFDSSDLRNDIEKYLNKRFDEDVAKSYAGSSDLFESFFEFPWSKESPATRAKIAKYLFTKAFIKGWNSRGS